MAATDNTVYEDSVSYLTMCCAAGCRNISIGRCRGRSSGGGGDGSIRQN